MTNSTWLVSHPAHFVSKGRPSKFGAFTWLAGAIAWLRRQRSINATIGELSRLDNQALKDIGIGRSQIRTVAQSLAENSDADPRG